MVLAGHRTILVEKPLVLRRIFFSVRAMVASNMGYESKISLGDMNFHTYYDLNGNGKYFESRGEGIFQGDVWVRNQSSVNILYTATEILV